MAAKKTSPGEFAISVFMGAAIYLILVNHGWQTLLTIKAVIFLLLGVFFSVLLAGVPFHLPGCWIERRCFNVAEYPLAPDKVAQLKTVITLLLVMQVVATFYATKLAYQWYFN